MNFLKILRLKMHFLIVLFICVSFIGDTLCRPQAESNENEIGEVQYESENEQERGGGEEDSFHDETRRSDQQNSRPEDRPEDDQEVVGRLRMHDDRLVYPQQRDHKLVAYDPNSKNRISRDDKTDVALELDKAYQTLSSRRREADAYLLNNNFQPQASIAQRLAEESIQDFKNHMQQNSLRDSPLKKRVPLVRSTANFEDLPYESREQVKAVKNEYVSHPAYQSEQPKFIKRYYEDDKRKSKFYPGRMGLNRERRQVQESKPGMSNNITNNANIKDEFEESNANEDDETAIKRHIKKLSSEELEELLNTLSEDKRALLKKIIQSDNEENINKREITKKAGAAEDSVQLMESGQADLHKDQCSNENLETKNEISVAQNADTTEAPKQSESVSEAGAPTSKNVEDARPTDNADEKVEVNDSQNNKFVDESPDGDAKVNNLSDAEFYQQSNFKNENKRETRSEDFNMKSFLDSSKTMEEEGNNNFESALEQENYYPQEEDLSLAFVDDNSKTLVENHLTNKRETNQVDERLEESMKSLEDSFPNSCYDGNLSDGNMAPHVRVKRKDGIKKRSAALVPESKVAFVPYRAENEDEDNDEGNEFDDEGFYDHSSNLARIKSNRKYGDTAVYQRRIHSKEQYPKRYKDRSSGSKLRHNMEKDLPGIGSDTDSVISSGMEGVNDNLMYNSAIRNRRSIDEVHEDGGSSRLNRMRRSTPWTADVDVAKDDNYISFRAPQYQENDAFGALPRNYEGDLSRYKRIRRVKQFPVSQEVPSSN